MPRYIDADKLNKKKKYSFQTQGMPFPKSEWFIKADDLFSAPTEDVVKVRHGEWLIVDDLIDKNLCNLVCSVCGRREYGIENVKKAIEYRPYCHCGAKMDNN